MRMNIKRLLQATLLLSTIGMVAPAFGQIIHSDDFNADSSGSYRTLLFTPENDDVTYAFDYGAIGIPEAPNSDGGGTSGVLMRANNPVGGTGATSAVQIVPQGVGMNLEGKDYRVTADLWMNANGPLPGGGGGSTQAFMMGVGFRANPGMSAIEIGNDSGTYFTVTGEGGASTDIRSFTNDGFNADGINQGPSNNSNDDYYAGIFPGGIDVGQLPIQGGTDNQIGVTVQGQMAFAWHELRIDKVGTQVDFYIDDLLIASDTDANTEGNVMLGYGDYFSSVSDAPQWSFGLWDNFLVEEITDSLAGDFDENGVYDCADIDFMVAEIASGNAGTIVDLTGDGMQDIDDITAWLALAGEANLGPGKTYLFADANLDGSVDVADFNAWNANKFTATAAWCSGDFSADGSVDVTDFNSWNANKFTSSDAAAVPEPSTLALLALAGLTMVGFVRRRK